MRFLRLVPAIIPFQLVNKSMQLGNKAIIKFGEH